MERAEWVQLAHRMRKRADLLHVLNALLRAESQERGGSAHIGFTPRQLAYYSNPNRAQSRYQIFKIPKKLGGHRTISAPRTKTYLLMLRCANRLLQALYTPSQHAMGFAPGRSVVSNAAVHVAQRYVYNIDLEDFFPSITQPRVWRRLQLAPFHFSAEVASTLAGLCCVREMRLMENGDRAAHYVLPQGAPTSPTITNMICDTLDRRLAGLARRFGLRYTRYADDITFSSMHNVYQAGGAFASELARIIDEQGFRINARKVRLQKLGSRQEVTGLVVSERLNVPRGYINSIRNALYIWSRYGYLAAYTSFYRCYKAAKGHVQRGMPDMVRVLGGKLEYLRMVRGGEDPIYLRLHAQYTRLVEPLKMRSASGAWVVLGDMPLKVFERQYATRVIWGAEVEPYRAQMRLSAGCTGFFMLHGNVVELQVDARLLAQGTARTDALMLYQWSASLGMAWHLCLPHEAHFLRQISAASLAQAFEEKRDNLDTLSADLDALLDAV